MSEVIIRSIRASRETWDDFRALQAGLERRMPVGRLSQADVLKIAVNSTSALLAKGDVHFTGPVVAQVEIGPVAPMVWRDEPKEPSG